MRAIRIFFKQIGEGLKNVFKQGWMSFSAILTITVALFLSAVLFVIVQNVDENARALENNLQIVVRLSDDADQAAIEAKLKSLPNVSEVTFKSKDESLAGYQKQYGDSAIFKNYQGENNPLKNLYFVKVTDKSKIEETASLIGPKRAEREELEKTGAAYPDKYIKGVYDLETGGDATQKIVETFAGVRIVGISVIVLVLFVSFVLISNTIRMTIIARRSQIQIMRLVGASNFFIRLPFFFEGIFIGVLGSVIPIVGIILGYRELINTSSTRIVAFQLLTFDQIVPQTVALILIVAVSVGAIGSLLSITRYLRK